MDETKGTQQDNPIVETPGGEKGTTPEKTPETLEEQVAHIKEAAFAEVGRYRVATEKATKAAETAKKAADGAETRLTQFIRSQEEAELEAHQDEPDKLTQIRNRQKERERKSELDERERELKKSEDEHAEALKAVVESTKEQNAREIATRLNVDAKTLVKFAKFTDGSLEAIEDLAKDLPKRGETKTLTPDSGKTIGGGLSDEAFIAKLGSGEISLDKDTMERAKKLGIVK